MSDPVPHNPPLIEYLAARREGRKIVPCYGEIIEKDGHMVCQKCGGREPIGESRQCRVNRMIGMAFVALLSGVSEPKTDK